ncbi:MAG: FAD-dependent oxidoreductase [Firmicutes bacterium]|nr:FAD-dependent oxidoreductase [Bacillota bacterium]
MPIIRANINGQEVTARPGQTILAVAQENGIEIPTLCHAPYLEPFGSCGMCVVEVKGVPKLLRACATEIQEGNIITTESEKLSRARKVALELLLSDHLGDCRSPCYQACPIHCDAQGYIALIANGRYREALKLIKETLPLPAAVGRVCPHPCEDVCRRSLVDEPVSICALKRLAADLDLNSPEPYLPPVGPASGKKVAIVGAGPAGLTAAYFLAQGGHEVTIYEKLPTPGGMLRYGIPEYRLPNDLLDREIATITALGVTIKTGVTLGVDITLEHLRAEYDAVFLALGAQNSHKLRVEGEDLKGVYAGTDFLRRVSLREEVGIGRRVAVVGGGNTAMDAARTALRLGAGEVTVLYRRSREEMPALDVEIEEAEEEGVVIDYLTAPIQILGANGKVAALKCQRMRLGKPDASGRRRPEPIAGSEYTREVDTIIAAIGQVPDLTGLEDDLSRGRGNTISVEGRSYRTNIPGVFAGGDVVTGPKIAVDAAAAGKEAAYVINEFLQGRTTSYPGEFILEREDVPASEYAHLKKQPRAQQQSLPPAERVHHFREMTAGLTPQVARQEAERCLECGCIDVFQCQLRQYSALYGAEPQRYAGEISTAEKDIHPFITRDPQKCILCGQCVRTCEEVRGVGVLGFVDRGFDVVIKPAFGLPLLETECESCGQCIDSCPTGALAPTSQLVKPGPWELDTTATTCPHCSVGCTLELKTRGQLLADVTPQEDSPVDGGNICRRGRFAPGLLNKLERLTQPLIRVDGHLQAVTYEEVYTHLAQHLVALKAATPPAARAVFASPRLTNEELYLIQKWGREVLATNNLNSFTVAGVDPLFSALGQAAATNSLAEIATSELIILAGADQIQYSHAIAGLKIKEAVARGGKLIAIGEKESGLTELSKKEFVLAEGSSTLFLEGLLALILEEGLYDANFITAWTKGWEELQDKLKEFNWTTFQAQTCFSRDEMLELASLWTEAKSALILYDEENLSSEAIALLLDLALMTGKMGTPRQGIIPLRPKNNSQGLLDMGVSPTHLPGYRPLDDPGLASPQVWQALEGGKVQGLFLFGEDPVGSSKDPDKTADILAKAGLLVVQDITLTATARLADIVLPAASFAEGEGTYTSTERRIQPLRPALSPVTGRQNWQMLQELARASGHTWNYRRLEDLWQEMVSTIPIWRDIEVTQLREEAQQWGGPLLYQESFAHPHGKARFLLPASAPFLGEAFPHKADITEKILADKLLKEGFKK